VEGKRSLPARKNLDKDKANIPNMPLPLVMGNPKEDEDKENK
jgi:hypothetical protein|tara:strand:+ start:273 stop:398 length:126 start_codon:yes stop_codon:yes gene_type:complete